MSTRSHTARRTRVRVALIALVVAAIGAGVLLTRSDDTTITEAASIFKTATVERGTLSTTQSLDGSVVLSDVTTVLHRAATSASASAGPGSRPGAPTATTTTQMITSAIDLGAAVTPGTVLYSVDSSPVVALAGALPAWRTLSTASSDGPDVAQLEASLAWLGYDPNGAMTLDDHFDSNTAAAVKAWQAGYGLTPTGKVALGSVVFLPISTTVVEVDISVGDTVTDGDPVLALAGVAQEVVIEVPSADQALFVPGLEVDVAGTTGTVQLLRSSESDGVVVVEAVIAPSSPLTGVENGTTVKVSAKLVLATDVLIVPNEALVSLIDGSYALQVVQPDGSDRFVSVSVLTATASKAAIEGDGIAEGSMVLQPI